MKHISNIYQYVKFNKNKFLKRSAIIIFIFFLLKGMLWLAVIFFSLEIIKYL